MFARAQASSACDEALVRIAAGDLDAISEIYDHCGKKIFFLAKSITGNDADSQDVLQNTVLKIMNSAKDYTPGTNAVAWILTVARSCALSLVRQRKDYLPIDERLEKVADKSDHTEYAALYDALDRLDPDERQIVVMKVQLSMKHKDIANLLGISVDASQKRYRRAVKKLNQYYCR